MIFISAIPFNQTSSDAPALWWIIVIFLVVIYGVLYLKNKGKIQFKGTLNTASSDDAHIKKISSYHTTSLYKVTIKEKEYYFFETHNSTLQVDLERGHIISNSQPPSIDTDNKE